MASFESALSGAVASAMANTVVYPLDLVKTLVQTQSKQDEQLKQLETEPQSQDKDEPVKDIPPVPIKLNENNYLQYNSTFDAIYKIYKQEGIRGLYQGLTTSVMAGFFQTFSYFFWYSFVRKYYFRVKLINRKNTKFTTIEELLLGIVAAATSQIFTNPISLISARQQTRQGIDGDNDFLTVAKEIYEEQRSIKGFWKGLKVSLMLTINPSITYTSYEKLKDALFTTDTMNLKKELVDSSSQLSPYQNFTLGVLSKMISTIITMPLIISKAWLQRNGSNFSSFQQVLYYLYKNEGLRSWWKGLSPQLAKGVLVQGLLFMFKGELTKLTKRLLLYVRIASSKKLVA